MEVGRARRPVLGHRDTRVGTRLAEKFKIKICLGSERLLYVAIQIDSQQPATVVRTQRYLSARIGGNSTEAEIGIAVGYRLACHGVPEQDMLAALGLRYGTPEATDFSEKVHRTLALAAYRSSVEMARERGT